MGEVGWRETRRGGEKRKGWEEEVGKHGQASNFFKKIKRRSWHGKPYPYWKPPTIFWHLPVPQNFSFRPAVRGEGMYQKEEEDPGHIATIAQEVMSSSCDVNAILLSCAGHNTSVI